MALLMTYEPADIVIHVQGRGIVLKEKSLIAYQKKDDKIVASGTEAERMAEQGMEDIVVVSPLRQGMVADYVVAVGLFSHLFMKAFGKRPILKPAVAVCVPKGIMPVEKQAIKEVLLQGCMRCCNYHPNVRGIYNETNKRYFIYLYHLAHMPWRMRPFGAERP